MATSAKSNKANSNKKQWAKKKTASVSVEFASTSLIILDRDSIEKKLSSSLKRARTYYQKAQIEWETYQDTILPHYHEWLKKAEGDLPSRLAALRGDYQYKAWKLNQADSLAYDYGISLEEAFARLHDLERHPDKYPEPEDPFADDDRGDFEDEADPFGYDEEDSETREETETWFYENILCNQAVSIDEFADCLEEMFGLPLMGISKQELKKMRKAMKEEYDLRHGQQAKQAGSSQTRGSADSDGDGQQLTLQERCKKKYREIVKVLHPDHAHEFSETDHRLWLDVQKAYEQQDEAFLDVVLARIKLEKGEECASTCWDIKASVLYYRNALKSLRKTLTREKKSPAWTLWKISPEEQSEEADHIRRELVLDLEYAEKEARSVLQEFARMEKKCASFDPEQFRKEEWDEHNAEVEELSDDFDFASFFTGGSSAPPPPGKKKKAKSEDRHQTSFDFFW